MVAIPLQRPLHQQAKPAGRILFHEQGQALDRLNPVGPVHGQFGRQDTAFPVVRMRLHQRLQAGRNIFAGILRHKAPGQLRQGRVGTRLPA